jgi:uncharacterized membrane protein YhaH (DUF805 family)
VSIALGLAMVLIVFLILLGERPELQAEFRPLMLGIVLFTTLSALSVASFVGSIRQRPWRRMAMAGLWSALLVIGWIYWPRLQ